MKRFGILLLIGLLLFSSCSSGGASKEDAFIGKWVLQSYDMEGETLSAEEMVELGIELPTLDIRSDKTASMNMMGEIQEATWKMLNDNEIEFASEGGSTSASLSEGKLTMGIDGNNMVYVKDDGAKLPVVAPVASDSIEGGWKLVEIEFDGDRLTKDDPEFAELEATYLEVKADKSAEWFMAGDVIEMTWEEVDGDYHFSTGPEILIFKYDGKQLSLDDQGSIFVFEKGERVRTGLDAVKPDPEETEVSDPVTEEPDPIIPVAGDDEELPWVGEWYGFFWVLEAGGYWADFESDLDDCWMSITPGDEGYLMDIYWGDREAEYSDIYGNVSMDENHFQLEDGYFWDMELDPDNWWIAKSPMHEGTMILMTDRYIDPERTEGDYMEYMIMLRPYGETWEEEINNDGKIPPGYDDYLDEIQGAQG